MSADDEDTGNDLPGLDVRLGPQIKIMIDALGKDTSVSVTGKSWKTLSRYVDGTEPPFSVVLALAQASGRSIEEFWPAGDAPHKGPETLREFTLVPRFDVHASAGNGLVALSEDVTERLAFKTQWMHEMGVQPRFAALLTCRGDSQHPTIPDGALMLVDTNPDQSILSGKFYVIVVDGNVLVKRLNRKVDGTVQLISDNPIYETEVIKADDLGKLHIAGRVAWTGHVL